GRLDHRSDRARHARRHGARLQCLGAGSRRRYRSWQARNGCARSRCHCVLSRCGAGLMLHVEALDVFYGDVQALDGVSLDIEEGTIVAIVGANGAGKTTLIRAIAGIHRAAKGHVLFRGENILGWPSHRICDFGIGQVAEGRQIFPTLTVEENLEVGALLPRARARKAENRQRALELFPVLAERAHQAAAHCRAASSRCWQSRAASWARRSSSCSTNPRSGSLRPSSTRCWTPFAISTGPASPASWSSRTLLYRSSSQAGVMFWKTDA